MPDPITGLPTDEELMALSSSGLLDPATANLVRQKRDAGVTAPTAPAINIPQKQIDLSNQTGAYGAPTISPRVPAGVVAPSPAVTNALFGEAPKEVQPNIADVTSGGDAPPNLPETPGSQVSSITGTLSPGMGTITETQTTSTSVPGYIKSGLAEAGGQVDAGILGEASAIQQKGKEGYNLLQEAQTDAMFLQGRVEEAQRIKEEQIAKKMGDYEIAKNQFMNMAVDPNKFYANMDTGNKVLAGISIALGALGGALTGKGDNKALDIINQAIERDIAAQEANINKAGKNVEAQENMISMYRQLLGDEVAARHAAVATHWGNVERQLATIAAKYEGTIAGANAQKSLGEARQKRLTAEAEMNKTVSTTKETEAPIAKPKRIPITSEERNQLRNSDNSVKEALEVRKQAMAIKDKLGPVEGRWRSIISDIGYGDKEFNALRSNLIEAAVLRAKAMFGAAQANEERKNLEQALPKVSQDPETFFRVMEEQLRKIENTHVGLLNTYDPNSFEGLPSKLEYDSVDKVRRAIDPRALDKEVGGRRIK